MKVSLTNVRGFESTHVVEIRPITILLGENSSGKTTLLASLYAVLNRDFPTAENIFNRAPFDLGSFDTIATYRGGKYGRATSFGIGWENDSGGRLQGVSATFRSADGTPKLDSFIARDGGNELRATVAPKELAIDLNIRENLSEGRRSGVTAAKLAEPIRVLFTVPITSKSAKAFRFQDLFRYYIDTLRTDADQPLHVSGSVSPIVLDVLQEMSLRLTRNLPHVTALSPLRTRPRRTYDELNDEFKPEGDHVPLVLARLLAGKQKELAPELEALMRYGNASGLFERIDVKRLGKQPSDPFQVRIKMKGPDANLIDVGYGVSQALPIVVDAITAPDKEMLLVQQPEVHLHPKAQAALGTFFVELAVASKKQFVVETHSDYLVDRIRVAVAEGRIPASDVQLLYLDRKGLDVSVHDLRLDGSGNITNAPPAYRNFFLQEELKLMSRLSK